MARLPSWRLSLSPPPSAASSWYNTLLAGDIPTADSTWPHLADFVARSAFHICHLKRIADFA
jgi:hypothetical protein